MFLSGCLSCGVKQDPDALKNKTADATAALKSDAKAVAAGIKEGLTRDNRVDLNSAPPNELAALPGITPRIAARIVQNRPYEQPKDLLTKKVISQAEYDKIASQVKVKK